MRPRNRDRLAFWVGGSLLLHAAFFIRFDAPSPPVEFAKAAIAIHMVAKHPTTAPTPVIAPPPAPKPVETPKPPAPPKASKPKKKPKRAAKSKPLPPPPEPPTPVVEETPDEVVEQETPNEVAAADAAASPSESEAAAPSLPSGAPEPSEEAMASYAAVIRELVTKHKRYPSIAKRRGIEGGVPTLIRIAADGSLEDLELEGRPPKVLARSTRSAVEKAGPFPPPPSGRPVQIEMTLHYDLDD